MLVERDRERSALDAALDDAGKGRGGTMLLRGTAGIGKTALVRSAGEDAIGRGMQTLTAVGGELEHDLAFGVVQQLFGPALRALPVAGREDVLSGAAALARPALEAGSSDMVSGADPTAVAAVAHGLYWLCSNLAEREPLLMAVDDVHWVDDASLRFLAYLARRVSDLPVLLLLAGRPVAPSHPVTRVLTAADPVRMDLAPLSTAAVAGLVREILAGDADDEFCRACAIVSGGNPFLVTEALRSLRAEQVRPVAAEVGRVERLRPEAVTRAVLGRIAGSGRNAVDLARAVAVLGPAAELRRVAALAESPARVAAEVLDRLAAEEIVHCGQVIEFRHPLVRSAVYEESGGFVRAADHKRAARLLHEDGASADELAPHLLIAELDSDAWVVRTLRAAAAAALARGAPEAAVPCLHRALAEPPPAADRLPILIELGRALGMANRPDDAADVWRRAYESAEKDDERAEIALEFGALMVSTGRGSEAHEAYRLATAVIRDDDADRSARATAVFATTLASVETPAEWIGRLDALVGRGQASSDLDRVLTAGLAYGVAATGDRNASECARLAGQAVAGPIPSGQEWFLANLAGAALTIAGRFAEAIDLHDRAIAATSERGDVAGSGYLTALRSHVVLYAGRPREAEADGRAACRLGDGDDVRGTRIAAAVLANALVERGDLAEAEQVLAGADADGGAPPDLLVAHFGLLARGRLRLRQGRAQEALADLRRCGDVLTGAGYVNPGFALWRSGKATAYLLLGESDAACAVAEENVELCRQFGAPLPIGLALHTAGLASGGKTGLSLLEEAAGVLHESGTGMWEGMVLVDYGAALRRAGQRGAAREPLRAGMDIAARFGATPLADRAAEELVAAGGRPRRARRTGPASLTASELRVAKLAAGGATNREIAQSLFVSRRTVELHLTHVYRKLGIDARDRLAAALREPPTAPDVSSTAP